ncbi:2-keto-4-pentenoate hydratase/2-oxohepta-3-ene-1,7-dioic acid hydratase (catechol pathway) [Tangfeifania diversioriginum]|uniref:2-keto-4-pentenoate hydratase/2-oxohepta-3-ene-1,7-dioic acid hydratase (Catechol pathway) n=1 Tax=Tangfeifania diversioriginum TaxID=1168035 RepID=A0A1M6N8Y0_9BACT|nr:fumarylacetoacetate hydrolase family protein [Tangfeifania diversioriginum]SHJ92132.1 2-keto-4-pentenoate hydratase/2-oxohepta-3-ene-1,7-dioic acid hydratase (catechol pathway) [Tangfeifania diversioriginum]
MKIICIGRNYVAHAQELNNDVPDQPVFFMKPDSALLRNNDPFYIPEWTNEVHYEIELVIRINRIGKNIEQRFAHRYYDEIGLGIDFTARDVQKELKQKGLPWEKAKAFDQAAAISSSFLPVSVFPDTESIRFSLQIDGSIVQDGNSELMIFGFEEIISHVSKYMTLKIGDLIYTGTPAGVGAVKIGDHLEGFLENKKLLDFRIK